MNWFRHDTQASLDPKIKRLISRHGAEGYAVYFHCLELIAMSVSENHLTFELEHDAEIIADNLKIRGDQQFSGVERVNTMMRAIVELGLFQSTENRIICVQLAKRITAAQIKNPSLKRAQEALRIGGPEAFQQSSLKITEVQGNHPPQEPQNNDVLSTQGDSNSSLKITEKVEFFTVEETRRDYKESNTAQGKNPEPVDIVDNSTPKEHPPTIADLSEILDLWAAFTHLPEYRGGLAGIKSRDAIRNHAKLYTQDERVAALRNYAKIKAEPIVYTNVWPEYLDPESFLRSGIAKYVDGAKPFDRCMGKHSASGHTPSKPKARALYCAHCGHQKTALSYCGNRECKSNNLDGIDPQWTEVRP